MLDEAMHLQRCRLTPISCKATSPQGRTAYQTQHLADDARKDTRSVCLVTGLDVCTAPRPQKLSIHIKIERTAVFTRGHLLVLIYDVECNNLFRAETDGGLEEVDKMAKHSG